MNNTANFLAAAAIGVIVYLFWQHTEQHSPQPVAWGSTQRVANPRRIQGTVPNFMGNRVPNRNDQVYASMNNPPNGNIEGGTASGIDSIYVPAFGPNPGAYRA